MLWGGIKEKTGRAPIHGQPAVVQLDGAGRQHTPATIGRQTYEPVSAQRVGCQGVSPHPGMGERTQKGVQIQVSSWMLDK